MIPGEVNIIGDVTQTLKSLLSDLNPSLDSPAGLQGGGNDGRLNLFLYQVLEDEFTKNQPWVTRPGGDLAYPPLALDLFYLVTPYASDTLSAHQVLAHAMQVLYENSILSGPDLAESLRLTVDQLSIILCPMQIEELTRIWNALQSPYRLSVVYEVRVVLVESQIRRDADRVLTKIDLHHQHHEESTP